MIDFRNTVNISIKKLQNVLESVEEPNNQSINHR